MSQSKQPCELCNRAPGTPHPDSCPRSRRYTAALRAAAERAQAPRPVWVHGAQVIRLPDGTEKLTYNPGIPYVGPGKPWTAGGRPRDMAERSAAFEAHLKRVEADLRGATRRPVHGHTPEEKAAAEGRPVEPLPVVTSDVGCPECKQLPVGQTGEYPCPTCGMPRVWDGEPTPQMDGLPGTPEELQAVMERADGTLAALESNAPLPCGCYDGVVLGPRFDVDPEDYVVCPRCAGTGAPQPA